MTNNDKTKEIEIKNARVNNLKGIDVKIPRNKFVVITGVSGSGKSSLAFDTLYAEGQRRYVESLNSYARQFLGRNNKPEVDYIKGIPPAIAIEQKVNTRNPRSTVGTSTEVYDYIKLLFARIGHTFSPISGEEGKRDSVTDVVDYITALPEGTKVAILCKVITDVRSMENKLTALMQQGFSRIEVNGDFKRIDEDTIKTTSDSDAVNLVIDRLSANKDADTITRLADSVTTAFFEGQSACIIKVYHSDGSISEKRFSDRYEADGMVFEEPTEQLFTFNSPVGACPTCEGFGKIIGIDEDLVIPDKSKSVMEDCVACWTGSKLSDWKRDFMFAVSRLNFPVHRPYRDLTEKEKQLLWKGGRGIYGIDAFFESAKEQQYKIQYRVILSRYRGKTVCPECNGTRLRKEATYIKVAGMSITDLVNMPIGKLKTWADSITLNQHEAKVAERLLAEIRSRLSILCEVGLDYLTLNRLSSTLSGGESQRINIATSLGSSLVGSLYILDEPSIGLHSRDTVKLIKVLRRLRDIGNTVVVVEHDEDIIRASDEIIDIGPEAGRLGGEVVFQGDFRKLRDDANTLTTKYLNGTLKIEVPKSRRSWNRKIVVNNATQNNLKGVTANIPLNVMTVVTGVSGSGKSTLVSQVLYPALCKVMGISNGEKTGTCDGISGDIKSLSDVEYIDQNPIGKSTRSNPATYLKAYDEIRKLMAAQQLSKQCGYTTAHFSFNTQGGRCEACQGEGIIKIEMQFMADISIECESCHGKRFKDDILEVKYRGCNISDILDMTINQAIEFFGEHEEGKSIGATEKRIIARLKPLQDVGLGYIKLGQPSSTLSGGESQRVKLAAFLAEEQASPTLFIFDEPTTGLHFHDINKLLKAFYSLIEKGHSLLIIEHNMDVIKCADWIIDMGPDGGEAGGQIVAEGTPETVASIPESFTGQHLKEFLNL
ncbi:MAG: excinuclease ABC subunit UvrA [Bacteroidales bacterium]|nr:excinuclease ABC subunit UvrA [Bacteroidales bacterium]